MLLALTSFFFCFFSSVVTGPGIVEVEHNLAPESTVRSLASTSHSHPVSEGATLQQHYFRTQALIPLVDPLLTDLRLACRKAHLLEDKKIPSVWVFDEVILEALGGNTRDLDSIWEETGQDYNFTRSGFKNARTVPRDGVAIPSYTVRTYKRRRQKLCDGVRM
ncbi:hypothetical protein Tco_0431014 [Tanacetum coccineum]